MQRLTLAWDWVLRLSKDDPSPDDVNQWLAWYESDERNKRAFDQAQAINHKSADLFADAGLRAQPPAAPARRSWRRRMAWMGAALAAGIAVLALQPMLTSPLAPNRPLENLVVTAESAAQQKLKETWLPDGSRVELASKTAVALKYNDKARLLDMQNGVAFFTVAHNRERPFIVRAGDFYVRAVGTAFNVRNSGGRVVVTVTEGTVDMYPTARQRAPEAAPPGDALRLKAGKEVVWENPAEAPSVATVDPMHALAWRDGRLEYLNEPLSSAIADINRYSSRKITIRDPEVGKLVFSGSVLTDSVDVWVQSVPALFPVDLQTDAEGSLVLVRRGA